MREILKFHAADFYGAFAIRNFRAWNFKILHCNSLKRRRSRRQREEVGGESLGDGKNFSLNKARRILKPIIYAADFGR